MGRVVPVGGGGGQSGMTQVVFSPGVRRAEVVNPRQDTCSREVLRHEVSAASYHLKTATLG